MGNYCIPFTVQKHKFCEKWTEMRKNKSIKFWRKQIIFVLFILLFFVSWNEHWVFCWMLNKWVSKTDLGRKVGHHRVYPISLLLLLTFICYVDVRPASQSLLIHIWLAFSSKVVKAQPLVHKTSPFVTYLAKF